MASVLKIKRTNTAGKVPTFGSELTEGELAINLTDKKLYTANSSAVFQLDQQVPAGTVYQTTSTVGALSEDSTVVTNVVSWANSVVDFTALTALNNEFDAYVANTNNWISTVSNSLSDRFDNLANSGSSDETVDGGTYS
jgi:Zn-dependent oligopeptidase